MINYVVCLLWVCSRNFFLLSEVDVGSFETRAEATINVHHPPGLRIITLIINLCQDLTDCLYLLWYINTVYRIIRQRATVWKLEALAVAISCLSLSACTLKLKGTERYLSALAQSTAKKKKKKKCLTSSPTVIKMECGIFVYPLPWWIVTSELPDACLFISSQHFFTWDQHV